MPWQEATPMEQRERFVRDHQRGLYTMTELCARYTISRKTGYKWLDRFDAGGRAALSDRCRAPHPCPHAMSDRVAQRPCEARRSHPNWGPSKLLDWLTPRHPDVDLPASSTAGHLLARQGLSDPRIAVGLEELKPGNIMLTKAGTKLLDFGLAKTGGRGGSYWTRRGARAVFITVQRADSRSVGHSSDIRSA